MNWFRRYRTSDILRQVVRLVLPCAVVAGLVSCAGEPTAGGDLGNGGTPTVSLSAQPGPARVREVLEPILLSDARFDEYLLQLSRRLMGAAREVSRERSGPLASARGREELQAAEGVRFHLAAGAVPNVYSAGAGRVYVTTGLLQRCAGEDELASVLAHEVGHLLLGHPAARAQLAAQEGPAAAMGLRLADARYSPAEEQQADEVGFAIYVRGGWDPGRYLTVWESAGGSAAARMSAVRARLDRLPPVALDYAQPPIADERWFGQFKREAQGAAGGLRNPGAERVLAALPSPFVEESAEQVAARRELERELRPPEPEPTPGPAAASSGGGGAVSGTEAPSGFEKGPRR